MFGSRMLENTEIDGLLIGLDAPRDSMLGLDVDPAYQIRLKRFKNKLRIYQEASKYTLLCISSCSIPAMVTAA